MSDIRIADRYLPTFQFSERHECMIAAEPSRAIQAAADYQPRDDWFFKTVIGLREGPMRVVSFLTGKLRERPQPFGLHDFTLLEQRDDALVYGLIGQFWKLDYGLRPVADGNDFITFTGTDAAKLALSFSASCQAEGMTKLVTETRVFCADRATRLKFLPYWLLIRPVSGLIRRRILSAIKKQSETLSTLRAT